MEERGLELGTRMAPVGGAGGKKRDDIVASRDCDGGTANPDDSEPLAGEEDDEAALGEE